MSTRSDRHLRPFVVVLGAIAFLALAVGGLPSLLWATAGPLHPQPEVLPSAVQSEPSPKWAAGVRRARQIVREVVSGQNLPGLSVAVGVGGDVVWAEGFGWADVETHIPVTPATRFRMGSGSTALTAAAVGMLIEQGRLELDQEIQAYVPEFSTKRWPVTLRQLMANVSGVGIAAANDSQLSSERCERAADALPILADTPLLFQPGTRVQSSPRGWVLVSAAVEAAAERPFLAFMRDQILQPLGMADTGAESPQEENPEHLGEDSEDPPPLRAIQDIILEPWKVVTGTERKPVARGSPNALATYYLSGFGPNPVYRYALRIAITRNLSCFAGSMAFFSTPSDLVRFELGINDNSLLRPTTVQALDTFGRTAEGYDGQLLGVTVMSVVTAREPDIVVAVMSNSTSANPLDVARRISDAFAK